MKSGLSVITNVKERDVLLVDEVGDKLQAAESAKLGVKATAWDKQQIIHDPTQTKWDSDTDIRLAIANAHNNYDPIGFLEEMYQYYLQAVQVHAKRAMNFTTLEAWELAGSPKWTGKSKFDEFLNDALLFELPYQLDDLKRQRQKAKEGIPIVLTLPGVSNIISPGNFDLGKLDYQAPDPALEKPMDPEIIEICEMVCKRNIETIRRYQAGELKLPTPEVTQDNALEISGLGDVLSENAKDRFISSLKNIKQK